MVPRSFRGLVACEEWEATAQCGINHRVIIVVVSKTSNNIGINIPGPKK